MRYFTRRTQPKAYVADEDIWPADVADHIPTVSDHDAVDTGLIDADGNTIMRAPYPIGFGRDDDW